MKLAAFHLLSKWYTHSMRAFSMGIENNNEKQPTSLGITSLSVGLEKAIEKANVFIHDLEAMLTNPNATSEQRARWKKDILEAKIRRAELQMDQAHIREDAANDSRSEDEQVAA